MPANYADRPMAASGSGAVFFLGTRAHYQVLQQPENRFDVENGNASTETIYQNPSVQELWPADKGKMGVENQGCANERWGYCDQGGEGIDDNDKTDTGTAKRRTRRRPSETTLCERDADIKPAGLNTLRDSSTLKTKPSRSRVSLLSFLTSLARRKRKLDADIHYLHHIESVLNNCTYRESCRCLDCQSRYFECDDIDEYSSDESDYISHFDEQVHEPPRVVEDDDEVFVDKVPEDNTSTDMLLETKEKMSVSSDEAVEEVIIEEDKHNLEVAAGTPVLLNYLLTHPITCSIQ